MSSDSHSKFFFFTWVVLLALWALLFGGVTRPIADEDLQILVIGCIGIVTVFIFLFLFANSRKFTWISVFFFAAMSIALIKFFDPGLFLHPEAALFGFFVPALISGGLEFAFSTNQPEFISENITPLDHDKIHEGIVHMVTQNPEVTRAEIKHEFPSIETYVLDNSIKQVFENILNQKNFNQARTLLDYHDADEHGLLPVMLALDQIEKTAEVSLEPQTYKVTLESDETAFNKLPCNWQKTQTYLKPWQGGVDQSDILDEGNIYITDKRIFFVGKKGSETVWLSDIAYMKLKDDAIQFFRDEGLSEIFAFPTKHHARYGELIVKQILQN